MLFETEGEELRTVATTATVWQSVQCQLVNLCQAIGDRAA